MINQDRVREMTRMAMLESGIGERELKISTYRRIDYVILQTVQGFLFGTVCFGAVCLLWIGSKWDILNQYFANTDYQWLLHRVLLIYLIFLGGYLVLCAVTAVFRHKKCRERRDQYLRHLHRLNKYYQKEENARGDE